MPADLVTGDDVDHVAAYVASVAGEPGAAQPPPPDGGQAADGKSGLHGELRRLSHAGRRGHDGDGGAELDQSQPPKALVVDRVTNGAGAMPPFKGTLSNAEIQAVADYVSASAGK